VSLLFAAMYTRAVRSNMLKVASEDYVRTAGPAQPSSQVVPERDPDADHQHDQEEREQNQRPS
jgi:hypothetical protein